MKSASEICGSLRLSLQRQSLGHAAVLGLHQLAERGELALQFGDPSIPLGFQLLDHLVELRCTRADLFLDQSRPLLQVVPNVTHGPIPALPH